MGYVQERRTHHVASRHTRVPYPCPSRACRKRSSTSPQAPLLQPSSSMATESLCGGQAAGQPGLTASSHSRRPQAQAKLSTGMSVLPRRSIETRRALVQLSLLQHHRAQRRQAAGCTKAGGKCLKGAKTQVATFKESRNMARLHGLHLRRKAPSAACNHRHGSREP